VKVKKTFFLDIVG